MMIFTFFNQFILPVLVLAAVGLLFGILIAILSKVFYVKEDTRVETVHQMLPGYNCGACGFPGCAGLANAIINEGASVDKCRPAKPDQKQAIRDWLANQEKENG